MVFSKEDEEVIIKKANELHLECKHQEIIELLEEQEDLNENVEFMWRLARALYNQSDLEQNKETKVSYIRKSLELINDALKLNNEHPDLYKWWAIATSGLGDYIGSREKIENAPKIKEYALKSLELRADDSVTLFLLGSWCFKVSSIGYLERTIANTIFGKVPDANYNEALDFFLKCYEIDPTFIRNIVSIADTYIQLNNIEKAKEYYKIASVLIPKNDFEKSFVEKAKQNC